MVQQPSYWKVLTRRKILSTEGTETETKLNRVLGLWDLTALGVGSTLGAGVYVLAGQIAKQQAGPSVVLSFAIAALASLLAGVCYAEFGARVPRAGSAYVYSYVCIGEFAAFVIGWNLILEYIIGTAAVCRGISLYFDTLVNDTLKTTFAEVTPIEVSFLGSYFDFFAFGLVVVFGIALGFGVESSAMANNFCTCLNISILVFVIVAGSIKADFANWSIDVTMINATANASDITGDLGTGGFFPFGFTGTLRGAATCFFGFVGFDCIATTGEEVRNPRKNIPRSILLSLLVIFLCYFGVSMVLTLMVPYYRQDPNAPLPYAFREVGWDFAMWIVSIGGLIGLLASLFGALFPLPRIMYSMAEDGLLFNFLGKVSPRFKVPVVGSVFAAILTAFIAGLFDLDQLVSLLSIGTLLAYSVVAISITILRYMDNATDSEKMNGHHPITETTMLTTSGTRVTFKSVLMQLFNCKRLQAPNTLSTRIVGTLITLFCLLSVGLGLIFMQAYDALVNNQIWVLVLLGILAGLTFVVLLAICLQPREIFTPRISVFRVPFVPIVPAVSVFINIYLMLQLDALTWVRFGIWMIIGVPMFVACLCMHDLKNPEKRNPRRIAFAKALKSSDHDIDNDNDKNLDITGHIHVVGTVRGHSNGGTTSPEASSDTTKPNGKSANGGVVAQNQLSLKSLDEIVKMSDVGEELIEMRHPNGKVFYIEDTRSNTSTATVERDCENGGNEGHKLAKIINLQSNNEATEEEKSAIALLDDVLQGEDDDGGGGKLPTPAGGMHGYSRKFSVDSVMLPSVIETTIVATVHSSSDSSEHDLDDVLEDNEEQAGLTGGCVDELVSYREECTCLAQQLVSDVLDSEALHEALNANLGSGVEKLDEEVQIEDDAASNVLERKASETSMLSRQSAIDDPMHSERFKNKLSQLILQAPAPATSTARTQNDPHKSLPSSNQSKLKYSKSETDLAGILEKVLAKEAKNSKTPTDNTENADIPKPPKLDPMLCKTINSLNANRVRPSLDRLVAADAESPRSKPKPTPEFNSFEVEKYNNEDGTVSFKTKLEAILRRGPSHRTQQRPQVDIRPPRAQTMIEIIRYNEKENNSDNNNDNDNDNDTNNDVRMNGELRRQSIENQYQKPSKYGSTIQPNAAEQLIVNARKTLRPVQNGAIS